MSSVKVDVSFILPIYNTPQDFLTQCVESLVAQTHSNIEILLVDDGSIIECAAHCDILASKDKRIQVIHKKNGGVGSARNVGLNASKGEWVCFVDPDDWVSKTMIEDALKYPSNNEKPDVIFWNYTKEYGRTSENIQYFNAETKIFSATEELQQLHKLSLVLTSGVGSIWAKLYKKDFLKQHNLYSNENLPRGQDVEYNVRIFSKVKNVLFLPCFNYHYRYDDNTASTAYNENFEDYLVRFITELYNDVVHEKDSKQLLKEVYIRAIHVLLTISVRYTFHTQNPNSLSKKLHSFSKTVSLDFFKDAIKYTSYKDFSLPRKVALFCLKHSCILGIYLIAKVRQMQYSIKQ